MELFKQLMDAVLGDGTLHWHTSSPVAQGKKNVKYNHCILFIYVMLAIIVCTNTTISHCLNERENKMHTFYNIM